ncbi:AGAP000338-PA [Anopheles gambiae str. PEST]|uniref:Phosphomevalonate kinase n=2 Tax=gambiae species complex TaxID=44542 RepID=Q7PS33_ANOGA|nr:probable phosphomevalonate kinase [Anopheles coluzzii]XP_310779.4 phosphomevalonate kinase [Anopheles gambiae]EAA06245.5 AGAP000338-PA [Anopheles gambiae str. PEST]
MANVPDGVPRVLLLLSGKRKCGKDFLADALLQRLGTDRAQIVRISEPIKRHWAEAMGLDLAALLGDGAYKERYRRQMIEWSDGRRQEDYGVFCRAACATIDRPICIVSDVRRQTDVRYFREAYGPETRLRTVRIEASEQVRHGRGWQFQAGVDDVQSECDLDGYAGWDLVLTNERPDGVGELLDRLVQLIEC